MVLAAVPAGSQSGRPEYTLVAPASIQERLAAVPEKDAERRALLESMFRDAGCGEFVASVKVPHYPLPDLVCTLPGEAEESAGAIVVGGHFDHVTTGRGAVDDWSGAALLPSLYESLKAHPRRHRYVFAAFASEETGLNGSQAYVRQLGKAGRAQVHAMINLECLGLSTPKVWASRADKRLFRAYAAVVQALGLPVQGVNVDMVGDDDSHPFLDAHIPVLTIHSVTQETFPILHSPRDQVKAIHPEEYYQSYRVAAVLLAYLDRAL